MMLLRMEKVGTWGQVGGGGGKLENIENMSVPGEGLLRFANTGVRQLRQKSIIVELTNSYHLFYYAVCSTTLHHSFSIWTLLCAKEETEAHPVKLLLCSSDTTQGCVWVWGEKESGMTKFKAELAIQNTGDIPAGLGNLFFMDVGR